MGKQKLDPQGVVVPWGTAAGYLRPHWVPLVGVGDHGRLETDRHAMQREFGYRLYLLSYRGKREGGRGKEKRE